ncbi:MAG: trypsin-like peptidase domain-containing protein [Bdellovibrionales bacterium]|nr:trypsin-like peptidase domain-containing protein [Bdellovibrionales bacterium]
MKTFFILAVSFALQSQAFAQLRSVKEYQIGSKWGKAPITQTQYQSETAVFQRAAAATAFLGGGTAFYIGLFDGKHVIATNHHVCPTLKSCVGKMARFSVLGKKQKVSMTFGTWPEIDLSLHAIDVLAAEAATFSAIAKNFSFDHELYRGQLLLTVGYGSASNPMGRIVANQDSDCKVFSDRGEFRFMADPDAIKPGTYKAWSFATGCDVSHGDSGSAMVDRQTGEVVGVIWTGKFPKLATVQNSSYLDALLVHPTEEIWTELSYAVPAMKIKEFLLNQIGQTKMDPVTLGVLQRVIQ